MDTAASSAPPPSERLFRHTHVVSFQETNVVGNVYFTHHLAWQGRCREMFIRRHAPAVLKALAADLRLVTLRVSCDYHAELFAFDEIEIEMRLLGCERNRMRLGFQFWRENPGGGRSLVAEGSQDLASMVATGTGLAPCPLPDALAEALRPFRRSPERSDV